MLLLYWLLNYPYAPKEIITIQTIMFDTVHQKQISNTHNIQSNNVQSNEN